MQRELESRTLHVAAALIFDEGRVLACQRRVGARFELRWEFPGGKIEPWEQPEEALSRELSEELDIVPIAVEKVFVSTHIYSNFSPVMLYFFRVTQYRGAMANRIFEQFRWVDVGDLRKLDFLEGDLPVIDWLIETYRP